MKIYLQTNKLNNHKKETNIQKEIKLAQTVKLIQGLTKRDFFKHRLQKVRIF